MTVWKYVLNPGMTKVTTPPLSRVLTAMTQGDNICIWFSIALPDEEPKDAHIIHVLGTGHNIPDGPQYNYISSVKMENDTLIFHVFEEASYG
jgi:hypothetical protein